MKGGMKMDIEAECTFLLKEIFLMKRKRRKKSKKRKMTKILKRKTLKMRFRMMNKSFQIMRQ
jgi:hypothetical protein